jgi:hypothetical protein
MLLPDFLMYQLLTMLSIVWLYLLDRVRSLGFWAVILLFTLSLNNYFLALSIRTIVENGFFAYMTIATSGHALSWASLSSLYEYLTAKALLKRRNDLPKRLTGHLRLLAFSASAHESIWYLFYSIKYPQPVGELIASHYWLFLVDVATVLVLFFRTLRPYSQTVLVLLILYMLLWFTAFGFRVSFYMYGPSPYADDPLTNTLEVLSWVIPLWGSVLMMGRSGKG